MREGSPTWRELDLLFRSHPWHGVSIGEQAPAIVTAFVEIVPTDTIKYELDKRTGILCVDRPQMYSNVCPSLYGFIPQTLCAEKIGAFCAERTGRGGIVGDGDPMDVCILTEKVVSHGNILVRAIPIGGLRMLDGDEADDKILAVLEGDAVYGAIADISQVAPSLIERLQHYFLTYKQLPGARRVVEITHVYGREEAHEVVRRSYGDYLTHYPELAHTLAVALRG